MPSGGSLTRDWCRVHTCPHAEGELVYAGPAAEVLPYFEKLGHKCPEHFNPAGARDAPRLCGHWERCGPVRLRGRLGSWRASDVRSLVHLCHSLWGAAAKCACLHVPQPSTVPALPATFPAQSGWLIWWPSTTPAPRRRRRASSACRWAEMGVHDALTDGRQGCPVLKVAGGTSV